MKKNEYVQNLERIIKDMLTPLKGLPFNLVIEAMTGKKVLPFNVNKSEHLEVLNLLKKSALMAGLEINQHGILRSRPNEVGNDIEPFVKKALNHCGLKAETPSNLKGRKKSTGYPDIIFWYKDKPYYLECKTYNNKNLETTQRSFYFSPSKDFKIIYDAPHLVLSYELFSVGTKNGLNIYKCRYYKILSIEKLKVDVKYEFNSDNKRMYSNQGGAFLLAEGLILKDRKGKK